VNFPEKKHKQNNRKEILRIVIYGLILDIIFLISIEYYKSSFSGIEFNGINNLITIFSIILTSFLTVLISSLIIILIDIYKIRKNISRNFLKSKILVFSSGLSFCIFQLLVGFNVMRGYVLDVIMNSIIVVFGWMVKILIFFGVWIVILGYLILKDYKYAGNLRYKISSYKTFGPVILLTDKKGNYRGFSILEVSNIPNNIRVRENRLMMKNIEKIFIDNSQHYLHYHLTVLFNYLRDVEFSYEISIIQNKVHFRFFISKEGKDSEKLVEELMSKTEIIEEIYKTSFPGLKFQILHESELENAWLNIINGIGNYRIKINKEDYIEIIQENNQTYIQIIELIGEPQVKAYSERTQIDTLIMALLSSNIIPCNFVVNITPLEIYKFENSKKGSNIDGDFSHIKDIRQTLLKVRHVEITGLWKVSAYFVIKSSNKDTIIKNSKKVTAILDSIFKGNNSSLEINLIEKNKLRYILPKLIPRKILYNSTIFTSEKLAAYLHLPEQPFPSINRTTIPNFEIPPEDIVNQKLIIGNVLFKDNTELFPVGLDIMDLKLNMFVTGLIGMGKTTFVKKINMFDPQISNAEEHARKLFSIIIELFKSEFQDKAELSVQMEKVCREIIREVVCNPSKRSLKAFFEELKIYENDHKLQNPTIKMTINALENRFDRFRHGTLKKIFDTKDSPFSFETLMDKKVVFDFNYLLSNGGTKQDVRFLMNLILKLVFDNALKRGITDELKHIVVVEDAQLLLPAVLREVAETNLGEDIPLLLRGVGQCMITIATRPEISPDIISNSGIKISFRSTYDSKKIANYQNLNKEQEDYLKIMPKREAIITIPTFPYSFRIKSSDAYFEHVSNLDIYKNNKAHFPFIYEGLESSFEYNQELNESGDSSVNTDNINEVKKIMTNTNSNIEDVYGFTDNNMNKNEHIINLNDKSKLLVNNVNNFMNNKCLKTNEMAIKKIEDRIEDMTEDIIDEKIKDINIEKNGYKFEKRIKNERSISVKTPTKRNQFFKDDILNESISVKNIDKKDGSNHTPNKKYLSVSKSQYLNYLPDNEEMIKKITGDNIENKLSGWEKKYWDMISIKGKYFYLNLRKLLKNGPYNKYQILKKLELVPNEFNDKIRELLDVGIVIEKLVPVFENNKLQKWFYLNNGIDYFADAVNEKIESDFIRPGIFGYAEKDSLFDYIWYSENACVKIYLKDYNKITKKEFGKDLVEWVMEYCDKGFSNIIIITGFIADKIKIKKWLIEWDYYEFQVFSFNKEDWENLKAYLNKKFSSDPFQKNYHEDLNEKQITNITANTNINTNANTNANIKSSADNKKTLYYNKISSDDTQSVVNYNTRTQNNYEIIMKIRNDFGDYYPDELLEKFYNDFPTANEIANYMGCNVFSVENEIKPIRKFLRTYKIHNFEDPNTYNIYYGWANQISGKKIMQRKISEQLLDNSITFLLNYKLKNDLICDIFIPNYNISIFIIFEENEIKRIRGYLTSLLEDLKLKNQFKIMVICYNIELKERLKRYLKIWGFENMVGLLKYDWSDIKPWIRKLLRLNSS